MEGKKTLVEVGMTARELVDRIGRPQKVFPVARAGDVPDQTVEVWAYQLKAPPDLGDTAEFVVNAGMLVVFVGATGGSDPQGIGPLYPRSKGYCTFWVGFGFDGKVRGVTTVEMTKK